MITNTLPPTAQSREESVVAINVRGREHDTGLHMSTTPSATELQAWFFQAWSHTHLLFFPNRNVFLLLTDHVWVFFFSLVLWCQHHCWHPVNFHSITFLFSHHVVIFQRCYFLWICWVTGAEAVSVCVKPESKKKKKKKDQMNHGLFAVWGRGQILTFSAFACDKPAECPMCSSSEGAGIKAGWLEKWDQWSPSYLPPSANGILEVPFFLSLSPCSRNDVDAVLLPSRSGSARIELWEKNR